MDDHLGALAEPGGVRGVAYVAHEPIGAGVAQVPVEWLEVERAHRLSLRDQAPHEVDAEEAAAAADRPEAHAVSFARAG